LFLDYKGLIESVIINGYREDGYTGKQSTNFVYIPSTKLKADAINQLVLEFQSTFSAEPLGCNRYVDKDDRTYIYTAVEPYFMNQVFPLFDQPDLKAQLVLITLTPENWNVNSTELPLTSTINLDSASIPEDYNDGLYQIKDFIRSAEVSCEQPKTLTIFKRTPKLPSYLFNFAAGEYCCLPSSHTYRELRMNLYCTHAKLPFLEKQASLVWELLNYGIEFFEKFFKVPYPFSKCDVVFVNEFSMLAM
jgi:aminopeptidase N